MSDTLRLTGYIKEHFPNVPLKSPLFFVITKSFRSTNCKNGLTPQKTEV